MKTIIAPVHLHTALRKQIMHQNNTDYLVNYRLLTFDQFLKMPKEDKNLLFKAFDVLNQTNLSYFKEMLKYPSFISDVLSATRLTLKYQVELNTLATNDIINQELTLMIKTLAKLDISEKLYGDVLNRMAKYDCRQLEIYPSYQDIFQKRLAEILLANGAHLLNVVEHQSDVKLYKALNSRMEVEAMAQYIVSNKLDVKDINIALPNIEYLDILDNVFKRYNIPYISYIKKANNNLCAQKFIALFNLFQQPTLDNFKTANDLNAFQLQNATKYYQYVEITCREMTDLFQSFNYYQLNSNTYFSNEHQALLKLELSIGDDDEKLKASLTKLLQAGSISEAFLTIYDLLIDDDHMEMLQIKGFIEDYHQYLQPQYTPLILAMLNKLSLVNDASFKDGISVTDYQHPILDNRYLFVVGLDQANYPKFNSLKGYYNEAYFKDTNLPSEDERYQFHINNLKWMNSNANNIIYSFAYANFNGKPKELSYLIEEHLKIKAQDYPLVENNVTSFQKASLSSDKAAKIFFNNNTLNTTVYKMEAYFKCPYQYFLKEGLKLKNVYDLKPYQRMFGTINHELIQTTKTKAQLIANYDSHIKHLTSLFPANQKLLALAAKLNLNNMLLNIDFINAFYNESAFTSADNELAFDFDTQVDDISVKIKGIIDQIDVFENKYRILDYKSSDQTINFKAILQGVKLQLIIYLYAYYKRYQNLIPTGVMYYSFSKSSIKDENFILSKGLYQKSNNNILEIEYIKNNKLPMLKTNDLSLEHGNPDFIKGLKNKTHDVIDTFRIIDNIIQLFVENLKNGNIAIDPVEGNCQYCDYRCICRYFGKGKIPSTLIEIKEDADDEME